MMKCCPCCFGDRLLSSEIFPARSKETGNCSYCGSVDVLLLKPSELNELFNPVVSIYEPVKEGGLLLVEWLCRDWGIFDPKKIDVLTAQSLLAEILDDGDIVRKRFDLLSAYKQEGESLNRRWDILRDELMHQNRYFPEKELDKKRMRWVLSQLTTRDLPDVWYRARIQQGECPYTLDQMGAPPKLIASHGRANPSGIPYLYLGSCEETAVAEVRPHTGELVCVSQFILNKELSFVNLENPRRFISPLSLGDEDLIAEIRREIPFIERLGHELTRPVLPQRALIDYVPSQYLCEFIKRAGYDGVIYSSSVGRGKNVALFDPSKAMPQVVFQRRVTKISVSVE